MIFHLNPIRHEIGLVWIYSKIFDRFFETNIIHRTKSLYNIYFSFYFIVVSLFWHFQSFLLLCYCEQYAYFDLQNRNCQISYRKLCSSNLHPGITSGQTSIGSIASARNNFFFIECGWEVSYRSTPPTPSPSPLMECHFKIHSPACQERVVWLDWEISAQIRRASFSGFYPPFCCWERSDRIEDTLSKSNSIKLCPSHVGRCVCVWCMNIESNPFYSNHHPVVTLKPGEFCWGEGKWLVRGRKKDGGACNKRYLIFHRLIQYVWVECALVCCYKISLFRLNLVVE